MNKKVDLSNYNNKGYYPGNKVITILWFFFNVFVIKNNLNPFSSYRIFVLKLFGAKIGKGVIIRPGVSVKYPWKLQIGDNTWIGENVWIDNLSNIIIGKNVCVSQGAMLLSGNHNYKKTSFDLISKEIIIDNGSWVGAKSIVCGGVKLDSHCVLSVGSVASSDLQSYGIYKGNPAKKIRKRIIK